MQAGLKAGDAAVDEVVVTDVAPFSLGIASATRHGRQLVTGVFTPIIERGTTIPVSRVESFHTMVDFQKELRVEVFQGEHSHCDLNQRLGDYVVKSLPPAPAGLRLDVRLSYDLNGILEVEMELPEHKRKESFAIEQRPGALTQQQMADARARMAGLKLHPRAALPNTTALARAEELFAELVGSPRAMLGDTMARFRAVLEGQRPEEIAEGRRYLNELVVTSKASRSGEPRRE